MKKIILLCTLFTLFLVSCTDQAQELQNENHQTEKYQLRIDPSNDGTIDDEDERRR